MFTPHRKRSITHEIMDSKTYKTSMLLKQNKLAYGAGFKPVSPKVDFPKLEEKILKYWKDNKIFEKTLAKEAPKGDWTFLDGPPFITGLPHYGSLLSSIPKDVFPRFKTMQGYRVRRVWGWDCHGLPAENKVETKLGVKNKKEIVERIGVKKFIDECKMYVKDVSSEWEWYIDHIGRFVDFKNAYKTMDLSYMESVLWVFKQMYDKGFIYKGLRVSLYCPHCSTPISNFEVAMDTDNYKEVSDPATVYKYQLRDEKDTFILAWSTTPWNKIVTLALAVNPKLIYVKVREGNENYILAKSTLRILNKKSLDNNITEYKIIDEFKGSELVGKKFVPHYDYYKIEKGKRAFEIIGGDFVTAEAGTGVVTIAAYGEEDLKAILSQNIHLEMHVDEEGIIKNDVPKFGEMYYLKANKAVNEDLKERNLIYKDEEIMHNVPLCWRCHTRLYYAPQNAWYVNVQKLKPQMKKTNELVNWFPNHFKLGRFLKSLDTAPDWNISRSRYFGSPVPVWECECGQRFVPGSIKELEKRSSKKITDLHKPEIDEVTVICDKCNKKVYRVPEVLDSWIEAGSASFGERHYPFDPTTGSGQREKLEDFYPPDFIGEYTGQIRAWFYVLHVIANGLGLRKDGFNALSKNVLVEGVILGTDGRKMSKNYGNYPDPKELLQKYGGDALRLYLMGSPVMSGEDILISEEQYRNQIKGMMLILWNVYNFFVTYANIDKFQISNFKSQIYNNILDRWILSLLNRLVQNVTKDLDGYDTVTAIEKIKRFVDDLSTWYIRRSRERVGPSANDKIDKENFYETCWEVLASLAQLLAPITPFLAEEIYRNLINEESVHLSKWPTVGHIDEGLEKEMQLARKLAMTVLTKRKFENIKVRQPLEGFSYEYNHQLREELEKIVKDEVNVENIRFNKSESTLDVPIIDLNLEISESLRQKGEARDLIRKIQEERKKLGTKLDEKVDVFLEYWPKKFEEDIKRKTLINKIQKGDKFLVERA